MLDFTLEQELIEYAGNTYSTALLIGEKCAVLTGEDLGYSGSALDMKVPEYNVPGEMKHPLRL